MAMNNTVTQADLKALEWKLEQLLIKAEKLEAKLKRASDVVSYALQDNRSNSLMARIRDILAE